MADWKRGTRAEWEAVATTKGSARLKYFYILNRKGGPGIRGSFLQNLRKVYGRK